MPILLVVSIVASLWQRIALAWMTFAQLVTFALGHRQQEIDFLILEGSRGLQDALKPNKTLGIFWSQKYLTLKTCTHGTPVGESDHQQPPNGQGSEKIQFEHKPTW